MRKISKDMIELTSEMEMRTRHKVINIILNKLNFNLFLLSIASFSRKNFHKSEILRVVSFTIPPQHQTEFINVYRAFIQRKKNM